MKAPVGLTVADWLSAASRRRTGAFAIRGIDGSAMTYDELLSCIHRTSEQLLRAGIGSSDIVLIAVPDGPHALTSILAVAASATAFPVPAHEAGDEYERILREVPVRAILMTHRPNSPLAAIANRDQLTILELEPRGTAGDFDLNVRRARQPAGFVRARPEDPALLVCTSGSTSAPKIVSLSHASLYASISHAGEWMKLTHDDRSLCVMPFAHIHSLVRSTFPGLLFGGEVICAPGLDRTRIPQWIENQNPTYITAAPSIFRTILDALSRSPRPPRHSLRFLVTGSDTITRTTLLELERTFDVPVLQFYGLTEASPLVATSITRDILPGAVGYVNPVWTVGALGDNYQMLPLGQEGEIVIKGGFINPVIGRTSVGRQRLTAEGWLHTGDLGYVDEDRRLFLTGRTEDRIHRGGEKVFPANVEAALLEHKAVREAAVFAIPDPVLGARVGAVVVPVLGCAVTDKEIKEHAATRLASFKVPEVIIVSDHIPTNHVGKISRASLAANLGLVPETPSGIAPGPPLSAVEPPSNALEPLIAKLFCRKLGCDHIGATAGFFELGGDSLRAVELLLEIEEQLGVSIPPAIFVQNSTVSALARAIDRYRSQTSPQLIVPIQPSGIHPPLFVAPNIDGVMGFGEPLAKGLGPKQPIYTFHLRDIGETSVEHKTMEMIAEPCVEAIKATYPGGPYYILGYSMGAHLALEIAQQLFAHGHFVAFLGIIDDDADLKKRHFGVKRRTLDSRSTADILSLALHSYVPVPYPGRITVFRAVDSQDWDYSDPHLGWADFAVGGVETIEVPGTHETVVWSEYLSRWVERLELCLAKTRHRQFIEKTDLFRQASEALARREDVKAGELHFNLAAARAAAKDGDLSGEIAQYRRALKSLPAAPAWAHCNLAAALIQRGEFDEGVRAYFNAVACQELPLQVYFEIAKVAERTSFPEILEEVKRRAELLESNNFGILRMLSHVYEATGDISAAEATMRKALGLRPQSAELNSHVGRIVARLGRDGEAIHYARIAAELAPQNVYMQQLLGQIQVRLGDLQAAEASYEKAMNGRPVLADVASEFSGLLERLGKKELATRAAERAAELVD